MIRDWEDGNYHSNGVLHNVIKRERKPEIITFSIQYSLLSKFTSFGTHLCPRVFVFVFLLPLSTVAIEERREGETLGSSLAIEEFLKKEDVDELHYMAWEPCITDTPEEQVASSLSEDDATTFKVEMKVKGKAKPQEATVSISRRSVTIFDAKGKVIEEHPLRHMKRWACNPGSCTLGISSSSLPFHFPFLFVNLYHDI